MPLKISGTITNVAWKKRKFIDLYLYLLFNNIFINLYSEKNEIYFSKNYCKRKIFRLSNTSNNDKPRKSK